MVESEGNGRMCTTLPRVLITVMGIEKVLAEWRDLEVMLQLLPRSSTAERMNPYTSLWTGRARRRRPARVPPVLLDAGRTGVLADEVGRQALRCIRCSACLNVCPVYARTGGHAYESVYPGPIGAILTPQLAGLDQAPTLPWASSLCGACYEVCPVKIDIPTVLVHLRGRVVREVKGRWSPERLAMGAVAKVFAHARRATSGRSGSPASGRGPLEAPVGPLAGWTAMRDLPDVPKESFREWWATRGEDGDGGPAAGSPGGDGGRRPARRAGGRMSARDDVLARVRAALGPGMAVPEIPRGYRQAGGRDGEAVARFCERAAEYRATVRRVGEAELGAAIAAACDERGVRRLAVAPGAGAPELPGVEVVVDEPLLELRELDARRRGAHRLRPGHRRHRDDRARRRAALRPARADARARLPRLRGGGGVGGRRRARGDRRAGRGGGGGAADHPRLRPERHVGHRAGPRRGRARTAHARHPGRGMIGACRSPLIAVS